MGVKLSGKFKSLKTVKIKTVKQTSGTGLPSNVTRVYTGSFNPDYVKLLDNTNNGTELTVNNWSFTGHTNWVQPVAVDGSGNVYSGGGDNTVRKLDSNGNKIWQFTGHNDGVRSVRVDADGKVYSSDSDGIIKRLSDNGTSASEDWSNNIAGRLYGIAPKGS